MATNVIRYAQGGKSHWGIVDGDRVTRIEGVYPTTRDFMLAGAERARNRDDLGDSVTVSDVAIQCPITEDRQFLCQAVNYHSHMAESGMDPVGTPFNIFFRKASSCLAPYDADIVKPDHVEFLDYEVEIGVVFRSDVGEAITARADRLDEYIGGLVVVNDVSARDVQIPEMQFYKGKSYRTFGPVGPYLCLVDRGELARFDELRLRLSVNGEERQNSLAGDMVHKPAATLSELSGLQNWQAGDLLATGTPGGCALQAPAWPIQMVAQAVSPAWRQTLLRQAASSNEKKLQPGDRIEATVRTDDGTIDLGTQHNQVVIE